MYRERERESKVKQIILGLRFGNVEPMNCVLVCED
jgi:hypothetical protein